MMIGKHQRFELATRNALLLDRGQDFHRRTVSSDIGVTGTDGSLP